MATTLVRKPVDAKSLSLGWTTLQANAHMNGSRPVIVGSFVTPDPRMLISDPKQDWYINSGVTATLRDGETALVTKLIPGLADYYRSLGLLSSNTEVIEVTPRTLPSGLSAYGHRATDPLMLTETGRFDGRSATLTSFFSSNRIEREAERAGLQTLNRPDSTITNNKASMRDPILQERYGINVLPGTVLSSYGDAARAAREFSSAEHGIWMKHALGSGGDYVHHIQNVSPEAIIAVRNRMYETARNYFTREGHRGIFNDFWPERSFSPPGYPFVIEVDANNMGSVLMGSSRLVTHRSGDIDVIFHSEIIATQEGAQQGGAPIVNGRLGELKNMLRQEAEKAGRYNMEENGYYGIQGLGWFLVTNGSMQEYYLSEINSRPTIATIALPIAEKLNSRYWINTNVYTRTPMSTIDDYKALFGARFTELGSKTPEEKIATDGLVIPIAFRTLVLENGRSIPSPDFKILICGSSEQHNQEITSDLEARGVSFSPIRRD